LHVPEREGALQNVNAIAVRPLAFRARVSGHYVETVHFEVAAPYFVTGKDLHAAVCGHAAQCDTA